MIPYSTFWTETRPCYLSCAPLKNLLEKDPTKYIYGMTVQKQHGSLVFLYFRTKGIISP